MCEMDDLHRVNDELPLEQGDAPPLPADLVAKAIAYQSSPSSATGQESPPEAAPYTIDEAITDAIEQMTGEPSPDPFTGVHNIEYWIWTGSRLVPASPEAAERIRRQEALEEEEFRLLRERQRYYRIRRREAIRRMMRRLAAPLQPVVAIFRRSSGQPRKAGEGSRD
jgi:hypothetical protein